MALRIPRGFARNRPYFNELCEGVRPNSQAVPRLAYSGLPHVRVDEYHHDPIVIDAGTIVGMPTGAYTASGSFVPAVMVTGGIGHGEAALHIYGSNDAATDWGLPAGASGRLEVGMVKPMGVVYQPIYTSIWAASSNYKRTHSVGILTDYVIQIPATNDEEVAINAGDLVMLGTGSYYGSGWGTPFNTHRQAGRYAKYVNASSAVAATNVDIAYWPDRIVGRCLRKLKLGVTTSDAGTLLSGDLDNFTLAAGASTEFSKLEKVQTVPGLGISGSGTKGVPAYYLGARAEATTLNYYALTILIRL